jgi:N-formylglutamate amidohydrolase
VISHGLERVLTIEEPTRLAAPLVVSSPHSGRDDPASFLDQARLHHSVLRRSEDMHVDRLLDGISVIGAPLLKALFPRAYLDVNREEFELDPRMFDGRLPAHANTRSLRVAGGLGAIPRVVGDNLEIYSRRLPIEEALSRIAACHRPYHQALARLLNRAHRQFGVAILVDCHSMPSASVDRSGGRMVDLVLGDRFGTSASALVVDCLEHEARERGYIVARNRPYAGGYITERYGAPESGRHAVQIEINRALYMDESDGALTAGFHAMRRDLFALIANLAALPLPSAAPWRRAAE